MNDCWPIITANCVMSVRWRAEFAREFPKIAGRLALDRDAKEICPDPYVERLLEGFAFLAARVHLKLDAEFPRFTQTLLETVYPHYLSPGSFDGNCPLRTRSA